MSPQYYNEFDPYAAQWLRNLIAAGHLPAGDVDERSIVDIQPEDLNGYEQCHFFAGIGVWPYALRRNEWSDRPGLWTGSCPCQPFSAAGQQLGFADERHLWPAWFHLITQRRPAIVLGEPVASALAWFDLVRDDLESAGYAVGAADLCAAGFPVADWRESASHERLLRALYDCPDPMVAAELLDFAGFAGRELGAHDGDHIRQRLYFVGMADGAPDGRREEGADRRGGGQGNGAQGRSTGYVSGGDALGMGNADDSRLEGFSGDGLGSDEPGRDGAQQVRPHHSAGRTQRSADASDQRGGDADWLYCRDGKWRPARPGSFPLAHAPSSRVGRLRAYGNALDAETVTAFVAAVRECAP